MEIRLGTITKFYPYEQAHASSRSCAIRIEDKDHKWYNAIGKLLGDYEIIEYVNCGKGYFNLTMDNKVTLELNGNLYVTLWDGIVYISDVCADVKSNPCYAIVMKRI